MKKGVFLCLILIGLIRLVNAAYNDTGQLTQNVNDCGVLNTTNAVYTLINNVISNSTCFNITANNITLDGASYRVNYSANGTLGYGVYSNKNYTFIKNINILEGVGVSVYSKYGIFFNRANNGTLLNNNVTTIGTLGNGIYLYYSSNNSIIKNRINTSVGWGSNGMYIMYSDGNWISNNTISTSAAESYGFYISTGTLNTLTNNNVNTSLTNGYVMEGGSIVTYNNSIDNTNLAEGKPVNYTFNSNNLIIDSQNYNDYGQVIFAWSNNITIRNSYFSSDSLSLFAVTNSTIENNTINADKGYGIWNWYYSNYNNIFRNNLNSTVTGGYCIYIYNSFYSNITENSIKASGSGIVFRQSSGYNNIINNTINSSSIGIQFQTSTRGNNISNNNISVSGSSVVGIYLTDGPSENYFKTNTILAKGAISRGFYIYGISGKINITAIDNLVNSSIAMEIYVNSATLGGIWNFTNVSRFNGNPINTTWASGASGTLIMNWYATVRTIYTNQSSAPYANVSAWDFNNNFQFSEITDINGDLSKKILTEFIQNGTSGTTKTYYSNYTFNASLNIEELSQPVNLSGNKNIVFSFTTRDNIYPNFYNIWDTNGTFYDSGIARFNVSVDNTNGTVWLFVNGQNIPATNLSGNIFNVSYNFSSYGDYAYNWYAYGNGTEHILNNSESHYYNLLATPPQILNSTPNGTLPSWAYYTMINFNTSQNATCKISTNSSTDYDLINDINASSLNVSHSFPVTGLVNGRNYSYYVYCNGLLNNNRNSPFLVNFSIQYDNIPPSLFDINVSLNYYNIAIIHWTTTEKSDSQAEYGENYALGMNTSLDNSLAIPHEEVLYNLKSGTIYYYRIKSRDTNGNLFVSNFYNFTTLSSAYQKEYYVALNGSDSNNGSIGYPFFSLEKARDTIRDNRAQYFSNCNAPVAVWIRGGKYFRNDSFNLSSQDGGNYSCPVIYSAYGNEPVIITGGREISASNFSNITDANILSRLNSSISSNILQANLTSLGITDFGILQRRQFGDVASAMELYFNESRMTLSRYPNNDFNYIVSIPGGQYNTTFVYNDSRPSSWQNFSDLWIHGWFAYDWQDSHEKIDSINLSTNTINLSNQPAYGILPNQWYYYENVLEELDSPGEYYIDRIKGMLYFWAPLNISSGNSTITITNSLLKIDSASNIIFRNITFKNNRDKTISVLNSRKILLDNLKILGSGSGGIYGNNVSDSGVYNSEISDIASRGIVINGGDRTTLENGRDFILNNLVHQTGQWDMTSGGYGISLGGVGGIITHNELFDLPYMGIVFSGDNQIVDYNEIYNVMNNAYDGGGIYTGGSLVNRGSIAKYNFLHDIYGWRNYAANAFYIDESGPGVTAYGNVINLIIPNATNSYISGAFQIGGGRDVIIKNNIILNSGRGIGMGVWSFNIISKLNTLNEVNYTSPPYSTLYPEGVNVTNVTSLGPEGTIIANNIFYNLTNPWYKNYGSQYWQPYIYFNNNSLETDPHFDNLSSNNFLLKEDSPVYALGFKNIPFEKIGLCNEEGTICGHLLSSLIISQPTGKDNGQGGGSGGSGAVIVPGQYVYEGWEVIFEFNNVTYTIRLDNIANNTATIRIFGGNRNWDFVLGVNETKKVDLNEDKIYDLKISLGDIIGKKVYITANSIQESVYPPETTGKEKEKQLITIIILLVIALIITWMVLFFLRIKDKKSRHVKKKEVKTKDKKLKKEEKERYYTPVFKEQDEKISSILFRRK